MCLQRLVWFSVWSPGPFRRPDTGDTLTCDPDLDPMAVCALADSLTRWYAAGVYLGRDPAEPLRLAA